MMRRSTMKLLIFVLLLLPVIPNGGFAQPEDYPALSPESVEWKLLPIDLTRKVIPLTPPDDLRLKLGATADGQQFLRIQPPRLKDLSFGVKASEREGSYIATAKRAIYWPKQHLLRLENDVIVSSTHCNLKGGAFDIHLYHDTARLEDPKEVLIDDVSLPLVSQAVRLSGLGHPVKPEFEWDPVTDQPESRVELIPEPTPDPSETAAEAAVPRPAPGSERGYRIRIDESDEVLFEGRRLPVAALEQEIKRIGAEEPESTVLVENASSARSESVRRVHQALEDSGIRKVQSTIAAANPSPTQSLAPEVEPQGGQEELSLPGLSNRGGRLIWVYEPGRYNLNGKDYTEPALRQALRVYAREYSDLTLVIASSRPLPTPFLQEFIRDIKAYGFQKILVAQDPTARNP